MAWNEPGKPGQDPWGKNSGNNGGGDNQSPKTQSGDELDQLLKKIQDFLGSGKQKFGGSNGGISGSGGAAIVGAVFIAWMLSGIYIIDPAERGVETRFGAFTEETMAGPHWHMPYPIETVHKVNVDQIRTAEIGYRSGNRSSSVSSESLMLTKDENIVDLKIAVQYQVLSANKYLFEISDPDVTLHSVVESALREVVGQNAMDFVLTEGRTELVKRVQVLTQERLDAYNTGLIITSVNLQDAQPPEQVQPAFADAVKAREDKERVINEAEAYSNDILPRSRGKAARELEEASAYHDSVIAQAIGESSRFVSIVTEYKKAPKVTSQRLYSDTIAEVLSKTSKVFIGSDSANNLLYLPLDKMINRGQSSVSMIPAQQSAPVSNSTAGSGNTMTTTGKRSSNLRDYLRNRELR